MTVAELIQYLQTLPQDLTVAYRCFSEQVEMDEGDIRLEVCQPARLDGWIHEARPDKPRQNYVMFPGN